MKQDHRQFSQPMDESFCGSLQALAREGVRMRADDIRFRLAALRMLAKREGLRPALELTDRLTDELARDGATVPLAAWLEAIGEAAHCASDDQRAVPLLMATVGVRLS